MRARKQTSGCKGSMSSQINGILPSCGCKRDPSQSANHHPLQSTTFVIQTPQGLEHLATAELGKVFPSKIKRTSHLPNTNGIIIVEIDSSPSPALAAAVASLACADAAAIYCCDCSSLSMDDAAIDVLKNAAMNIDWETIWSTAYSPLLQQQPNQHPQCRPTFRCSCSRSVQMADWGYNSISHSPLHAADIARIFARSSDAAVSQTASHVSMRFLWLSSVLLQFFVKCLTRRPQSFASPLVEREVGGAVAEASGWQVD